MNGIVSNKHKRTLLHHIRTVEQSHNLIYLLGSIIYHHPYLYLSLSVSIPVISRFVTRYIFLLMKSFRFHLYLDMTITIKSENPFLILCVDCHRLFGISIQEKIESRHNSTILTDFQFSSFFFDIELNWLKGLLVLRVMDRITAVFFLWYE